ITSAHDDVFFTTRHVRVFFRVARIPAAHDGHSVTFRRYRGAQPSRMLAAVLMAADGPNTMIIGHQTVSVAIPLISASAITDTGDSTRSATSTKGLFPSTVKRSTCWLGLTPHAGHVAVSTASKPRLLRRITSGAVSDGAALVRSVNGTAVDVAGLGASFTATPCCMRPGALTTAAHAFAQPAIRVGRSRFMRSAVAISRHLDAVRACVDATEQAIRLAGKEGAPDLL